MCRALLSVFTISGVFLIAASCIAGEIFDVYAPPGFYGKEQIVLSHVGPVSVRLAAKPLGKTIVKGQIIYFAANGEEVTEDFFGLVSVRTGSFVGTVRVRFKGVPLGSTVRVQVN